MKRKRKLTAKQEKFCKKYVELSTASEAYRQSYNATNTKAEVVHVRASELVKNSKIAVRIEELQNRQLKKHDLTVDSLLQELDDAREIAQNLKEASPMITATMGKAKIGGFLKDKLEHTGKDGQAIQHEVTLSQEEIRKRADEMRCKGDYG